MNSESTAHGVAVAATAGRTRAQVHLAREADASYLCPWRVDPKARSTAAGGSPAKSLSFRFNGKLQRGLRFHDLSAQAIAFDPKGTLYVRHFYPMARSTASRLPARKSYSSIPKTKYIVTSPFRPTATLMCYRYKGQVFAVARTAKAISLLQRRSSHSCSDFRCKRKSHCGTEPSGRILRISKSPSRASAKDSMVLQRKRRKGFVLYETAKREVLPWRSPPDAPSTSPRWRESSAPGKSQRGYHHAARHDDDHHRGVISGGKSSRKQPFGLFPQLLSSTIYRISPDGAPESLVFARRCCLRLGLASDGRSSLGP